MISTCLDMSRAVKSMPALRNGSGNGNGDSCSCSSVVYGALCTLLFVQDIAVPVG